MHDDLLERRLGAALRDEVDRIPFTITAAELERRMVLRGRNTSNRRLGLLLAATVAVGALGTGALIGGLADRVLDPTREPSLQPPTTAPSTATAVLPTLSEMIDAAGRDSVQLAQSRDDFDGTQTDVIQLPAPRVHLGVIQGIGLEILVACDAPTGGLELDIRLDGGRGPASGPMVACDRMVHVVEVARQEGQRLSFTAPAGSRWRVVVRTARPPEPAVPEGPFISLEGDALQDLLRLEDQAAEPGTQSPDAEYPLLREVGPLPARWAYDFALWCIGSEPLQYIHGDTIDGVIAAATTVQVACDGRVHRGQLGYPEPNGTTAFVAVAPGTRWSVLVGSERPPVALVDDQPGWALAAGLGPDLEFDTTTRSFAGVAADGGGPLQVTMHCIGDGDTQVEVDLRASGSGTFVAGCPAEGAITSATFDAPSYDAVRIEYRSRPGWWTALSILIPDREATE